jgi:hypothetical protein
VHSSEWNGVVLAAFIGGQEHIAQAESAQTKSEPPVGGSRR